ncbi:MAG: hypothetical protein IJ218_03830 [Alphaproteobacteria bacterium]|nr:hypothetical protein [Alphaproteobacteria bacterium]
MTGKLKIFIVKSALFIGLLMPYFSAHAETQQSCSNQCGQIQSCKPKMNGKVFANSASNQLSSKCLGQNSKDSCFNSVPVDKAGSYNSVGNRGSSRNHYGTDIGMNHNAWTNVRAYPVADGGEIAFTGVSDDGGRTMVINYPKKCSGGSGSAGYHTVYRHLYKYAKTSGSVGKNDPIGIVGGSNRKTKSSCGLCDNPNQGGRCAKGCYYDIHLHMELEDGIFSGSGTRATASKTLMPYCDNINTLCGGCPVNNKSCAGNSGVFSSGNGGETDMSGYSSGGSGSGGGNFQSNVDNLSQEAQDAINSQCELSEYLDSQNCFFCGLFRTLFDAASSFAKLAVDSLTASCKTIVGTGFLVWLCYYVLKQIANLGGASTGEMLKGILYQGFRVALVTLILSKAATVYEAMDLTLNPVMQTGLSFVNSINKDSTCPADAPYLSNLMGYDGKYSDSNADGGLPRELGKSILCNIKKLEDSTGFMMSLGNYSMCLARNDYSFLQNIFPHFGYWTTGALLWLAGLIILLTFPWCLIDCMLQMCIAAALIPCAIACYAFNITKKYMIIVWNFFMNAMFNFVFMGLIVYIINSHLKDWIGMDITDTNNFNHEVFITGWGDKGLAWWGPNFLKIAAIVFFCYTFFEEVGDMSKKFAESPGLGGKAGIGRMVGGTLQSAVNSAGMAGASLAWRGAKTAGSAANSLFGNQVRSGINHLKGRAIGMLPKGKKIVENGKTIGYQRNIRLFGRDISRTITKDENGVWTSEKSVHKRSATDKAFEKVYDANGNVLKDAYGHDVYRYRKRVAGITTGYEEMTATRDANGNLVYTSADGKAKFTMGENGQIQDYKTRFTVNLDNLTTRKMSKVYDENGRVLKDAEGKDVYQLKHQLFGLTIGKEQLNAQTDSEGNTTYMSADRKSSFTFDGNGQLNNLSLQQPSRTKSAKQYGTTRTVNDAFAQTKQKLDTNGNVVSSQTTFQNVSSDYLVNKDGTINEFAFNQIKNGTQNPEVAATAMVSTVLQSRGQQLDNTYANRDVKINDDGSFTINQTNTDGSTQIIHAQIIGNQMVINNALTDANGNIYITKSNGMQTKTESYTRRYNKKTGKISYSYQSRLNFSDNLHSKNSHMDVLNADGRWGNNLDPTKVMAGFSDADYQQHLAQLKLQKLRAKLLKDPKVGVDGYNKLLKDKNSEVYKLNAMLSQTGLSEGVARTHAGQAMEGLMKNQLAAINTMIKKQEKGQTELAQAEQKLQAELRQIQQERQRAEQELTQIKQQEQTQSRNVEIMQQRHKAESKLYDLEIKERQLKEKLQDTQKSQEENQQELVRLQRAQRTLLRQTEQTEERLPTEAQNPELEDDSNERDNSAQTEVSDDDSNDRDDDNNDSDDEAAKKEQEELERQEQENLRIERELQTLEMEYDSFVSQYSGVLGQMENIQSQLNSSGLSNDTRAELIQQYDSLASQAQSLSDSMAEKQREINRLK